MNKLNIKYIGTYIHTYVTVIDHLPLCLLARANYLKSITFVGQRPEKLESGGWCLNPILKIQGKNPRLQHF
jgi:hypothetical protein